MSRMNWLDVVIVVLVLATAFESFTKASCGSCSRWEGLIAGHHPAGPNTHRRRP